MVEGREAEGESAIASTASPSPVKSLLNGVKQNGKKKSCNSALDRYPLRLRNPDLSNCHVCDSQINLKGSKDKIRTLDSHWRIVIICNSCSNNLQSAKTCSYCFTQISELGICCRFCNRRIHQGCMSMYGRLNSCSDLDSFMCIDCWVPKSIKKVGCNEKRSGNISIAVNLSSLPTPRFSMDPKDNSAVLEDAVKDAKSNAETELANADRARKKALEKAAVTKQATEMAANVLGMVAVTANEESKLDDGYLVDDDAELALRLHRTINSSARIFKNVRAIKLHKLLYPKVLEQSGNSLSTQSDPKNQIASELEVGTDNLISENTDEAALEPSLQIGTTDHGSCNDLGTLEQNQKIKLWEPLGNCSKNGVAGMMIDCERILDVSQVQMSDCQVCILALPSKEEQSNILRKERPRSYYKKTYSRSRCCRNQGGLIPSVALNDRGKQCRSVYDLDFSSLEKNSSRGTDMFLKKYSRRCRGGSKYMKKYSRRYKRLKGNFFHQTSTFLPETSCLTSRSSGNPLPLLWMSNKEELTSNGLSAPSQASMSAGL